MIRLLCLFAVCVAVAAPCIASEGVLVNERVVNLPDDQDKWYVSVVGDGGARYNEILGWFENDENLSGLRKQVKFCRVTSDSAIYRARYYENVKGLPTVRVQQANGVVVYESHGNGIPMTPDSLYSAIAGASESAQGIRPILPWRRKMENRKCPGPCPNPNPNPDPPLDPEPDPIDDGGSPDLGVPEKRVNVAAIIGLCVLSVLGGAVGGGVVQWKRTYGRQ